MQQKQLFILFLLPSWFSFIVSTVIAIVVLAVANWSYFTTNVFYGYLFEEFGLTAALQAQLASLDELAAALSTQPYAYEAIVLIAASVVGLTVYVILQAIQHILSRALEDYVDVEESNGITRSTTSKEVGTQWAIRITSVILFVLYTRLFADYIVSFSVLLSLTGIEQVFKLESSVYSILAVVLLIAALHIHVVLMRFMILRPRLFGGRAAISSALLRGSR